MFADSWPEEQHVRDTGDDKMGNLITLAMESRWNTDFRAQNKLVCNQSRKGFKETLFRDPQAANPVLARLTISDMGEGNQYLVN